jgi:cell division protein FtsL
VQPDDRNPNDLLGDGVMAPRPNTKKRADSQKKRSGKNLTGVWVLILALFMGELLFYTWCRVKCVEVGIAISAERRKAEDLNTLHNSLKIELARLKAPERISYIARNKLGLDMPEPSKTILVP